MTGWLYLSVAIILEIAATTLLKMSNGLDRWGFAAASIGVYALCFLALAPALKSIPVGIAYAVWSGVGIVAMAVIGIIAFQQKLSPAQIACIALVLVGALGLRLTTPGGGEL
ncbi:MAG: DMT family transporter [Polymorphobacter sp.]|uniref:DMT family transporter n=1 Tax=Polymorphobacter sp. TaxID=1909290 RepID=UPI003A839FE3